MHVPMVTPSSSMLSNATPCARRGQATWLYSSPERSGANAGNTIGIIHSYDSKRAEKQRGARSGGRAKELRFPPLIATIKGTPSIRKGKNLMRTTIYRNAVLTLCVLTFAFIDASAASEKFPRGKAGPSPAPIQACAVRSCGPRAARSTGRSSKPLSIWQTAARGAPSPILMAISLATGAMLSRCRMGAGQRVAGNGA